MRGGDQNLSLPPGASYPRYATELCIELEEVVFLSTYSEHVDDSTSINEAKHSVAEELLGILDQSTVSRI